MNKWEVLIKGDFIDHETAYHDAVNKEEEKLGRNLTEKEDDVILEKHEYGDNGYEISVIRKDNEHGHASWGWGGEDKIILFSDSLGGNHLDYSTESEAFAKKVAHKLCDALNEE